MTSPLLAHVPGAVPSQHADVGTAAHYGDPLAEQRRAAAGTGVVDLSHRPVLRVGGSDRLSWLHSLTTARLADLAPWQSAEALVLSPHGHIEHHLHVVDDGSATWLDIEPDTVRALTEFLGRMVFLLDVDPQDVTAEWALLRLTGPTAEVTAEAVVPSDQPMSGATHAAATQRGGWLRRGPAGVDLLVRRHDIVSTWDLLVGAGASPLGAGGAEALRVADRRPRLRHETDHRTIPNELPWLHTAVHLQKGCYRGQETVARVHNLGRPPRRLVLGHLDGSVVDLPPTGTPIQWDGADIGFVGTSAQHHELGPIALGLVKRTVPDDAHLSAAGIPLAIEPTPLPLQS